jgi:hypothetical protein
MALLSKIGSRVALGGIATAGLAAGIGSSGREAAMDAAFGDPNADRAFLGSNLSGRFLLGSAMGGTVGGILQNTAPMDMYRTNPLIPTSATSMGSGALIGGGAGLIAGTGIMSKLNRGPKGIIAGGLLAGAAGAIAGGSAPITGGIGYAAMNRDFFSQSPYANRSSTTAAALNASGDIVLGMHNSRSSY